MSLLSVILRVKAYLPLVTKGSALTWDEVDNNFVECVKAIQALNALVGAGGVLFLQGGYDPTGTSLYPTSANTTNADNPQNGYAWYITTAGMINGHAVSPGQLIFAIANNAANNNDAQWVIIESGFVMADLFKAWAMTLAGYDNTKQRCLATAGDGSDTFVWADFSGL